MNPDLFIARLTYRYELLLLLVLVTGLLWSMYSAGTQGVLATTVVTLVLLTARSLSQFKRRSEDLTPVDRLLASLPLRYELLIVLCLIVTFLWWLAAGVTGLMLGLGVTLLAVVARSTSQLKRGTAVTVEELQ